MQINTTKIIFKNLHSRHLIKTVSFSAADFLLNFSKRPKMQHALFYK